MWTINILDKGRDQELIAVQVEFKNGDESIKRNFAANTKERLVAKVKQYKEALEKRDADFDDVQTGTFTPTEETPTEPTQAELDERAWREKREQLREVMELVRDGVLAADAKPVTDLQAAVRKDLKPAYLK